MRPRLAAAAALAAAFAIAACSSPPSGTPTPGATTVPPAATAAGQQTTAPVAGEPCSFLTAEEVAEIVEATRVEVAERVGRGDCDYFLTSAKDAKVNIGVFTTPDTLSYFDTNKTFGDPQPVAIGDDAYSIYNESIGTLVMVKEDQTVIAVQVFTSVDPAIQLIDATAIAQAVFDRL